MTMFRFLVVAGAPLVLCGFVRETMAVFPPQNQAGQTSATPNIVLVFPDNLGWGEVGMYGGVRGVPTPNIDRIAREGIRLTNFNVEYSCVVSRAALLTGRWAVRTAATQATGMTLWEVTIAESLKSLGYSTALFGKWHLGGDDWEGSREPKHQGFDEWYGIPGTSNVAQHTSFEDFDPTQTETPYIWEGNQGEPTRKVKVFDLASRRTIDRECALRGIDFMERCVGNKKPFFLYYAMTQIHFPTLPHPDFDGKTGAGDIGDSMADVDHNVGLVLAAIDRLGIKDDTIVIWCTDNGAEERRPWRGSPGPWRGFYNTVFEGGVRTPCVMRWPGHFPAGMVSNEIVHAMDLFPTFLAAAGGENLIPKDRAFDAVNQLPFLEGKQDHSNRDSVIYIDQSWRLLAVKWRDWKFWYRYSPQPGDTDAISTMRLFNLRSDPREETDVKDFEPWVKSMTDKIVADFEATVEKYPHVPARARDPYTPGNRE